MKRQLIALGLLTASILPTATPAFAGVIIQESEGSVKSIGTLNQNENYALQGILGNSLNDTSDTSDTFSFTVPETGDYTFTYDGVGASNGNLKGQLSVFRIIKGLRKQFSINNGVKSTRTLSAGSYRVTLEGESTVSSLPGFYQANIITPNVSTRNVTVDIISAEARDNIDKGKTGFSEADFYVNSSMNNVRKTKTKVHGNNNKPAFNHRISHAMPIQDSFMLIKLDLLDEDPAPFDSDDRADINPSTKSKSITLKYFPKTREVINASDNTRVGFAGSLLSLAGTNGPKATLKVKINHVIQ